MPESLFHWLLSQKPLAVGAYLHSRHAVQLPISPPNLRALRRLQGGGNCGNALTAAARLGLSPACVTKIGGDGVGDGIIAEFQRDGVDTQFVLRASGAPSPFTYIIVDREGGCIRGAASWQGGWPPGMAKRSAEVVGGTHQLHARGSPASAALVAGGVYTAGYSCMDVRLPIHARLSKAGIILRQGAPAGQAGWADFPASCTATAACPVRPARPPDRPQAAPALAFTPPASPWPRKR